MNCPPRSATPRTPGRPTEGDRARRVAAHLGITLAGWQADALDVAGELEVDGDGRPTGRMAWPVVVWIVPRRSGKSLAVLIALLARALSAPSRRCWYTVHQREVGAALWRDEWFPLVAGSPLAPAVHLRYANGSQAFTVRGFGSTVRLIAPNGQALRSQNADMIAVDEALKFTIAGGDQLEAAARPAFLRRPARQLWIVSSAGRSDDEAPWLARWRDAGRLAVDSAATGGVCLLEYGAPAGAPWDDPATWRLAHPSIADGTVPVEALAADLASMDPDDFRAEYLGIWAPPTARAVDLAGWSRCADQTARLPDVRRWVTAEVTPDRRHAAVAVAAPAGDRVHVEVVAAGDGAAWVAATVADLAARHRDTRVRLDSYGPAGNIAAELAPRLRDRLELAGTADVARACATLHDLTATGRLRHRAQPELDGAVTVAVARRYGDSWLWDRRVTPPELTAATLAADAAARPARTAKPVIVTAAT